MKPIHHQLTIVASDIYSYFYRVLQSPTVKPTHHCSLLRGLILSTVYSDYKTFLYFTSPAPSILTPSLTNVSYFSSFYPALPSMYASSSSSSSFFLFSFPPWSRSLPHSPLFSSPSRLTPLYHFLLLIFLSFSSLSLLLLLVLFICVFFLILFSLFLSTIKSQKQI